MTKFCTALLAFFLSVNLFAQNATISGTITDAQTKEPLFTATVAAAETGTTADMDGQYQLELPAGEQEITFTFVGYEIKKIKVNLQPGVRQTLDVVLSEEAMLLNTATVTSGKYEKPLSEVTVSLEVLKPDLIERTNSTSVKSVLDKVPGVSFVGDQANIRGGSGFSYGAGSRVLLLIDDIPFLQADSGVPQWGDVPFENLEQIEVIKGAASALYGSSALNGVVNARTAYAKSKPETKIVPYYTYTFDPPNKEHIWYEEQPRQLGLSVSHKRKIGKFDLILSGFARDSKSHNELSDSRKGRVNGNFRYRFSDRLIASVNASYNKSESNSWFYWRAANAEDLSSLRSPDPSTVSNGESTRYNIDPQLTYFDKNNGKHRLQGRYYNTGNNNDNVAGGDQSNTAKSFYSEYQYQKNFTGLNLVATTGIVFTNTDVAAPLYGNYEFNTKNYAGYLQLDKKIGDRLNLSTGVRFERNELNRPEVLVYEELSIVDTLIGGKITESRPVYRAGLNYKLADFSFLRASWGQGYRFPTIAEKYIFTSFGGANVLPNVDLQSETGWTAEIGIKQGYKISNLNGFVDVSFFWSEYNDMMEFNTINGSLFGGFQSQNVGNTEIKGFEVSLVGTGEIFGIETSFLAGYTFLDPRFKEFDRNAEFGTEAYNNANNSSICNGLDEFGERDSTYALCENILKYRSRHSAKLDIQLTKNKFSVGFGAVYNSHMVAIDNVLEIIIGAGSIGTWRRENNNGSLILSTRAAYQATDFLKVSLIGNNITNQEWMSRPGQLQAPANLAIRMDFDF